MIKKAEKILVTIVAIMIAPAILTLIMIATMIALARIIIPSVRRN